MLLGCLRWFSSLQVLTAEPNGAAGWQLAPLIEEQKVWYYCSRKVGKKNRHTIYGDGSFFWNLEFGIWNFAFFVVKNLVF